MTTPIDGRDPTPETIIRITYLKAIGDLRRLKLAVVGIGVALAVALAVAGWAIVSSANSREAAHADTQTQIAKLACSVVDQIPPDHGTADQIRVQYACGPYKAPKAVVQPKPGVVG